MKNNIPQHLINEATSRGLVPGAFIRSAWPKDNIKQAFIPPHNEWLWDEGDGNLYFRSNDSGHWIHDRDSGRWATIIDVKITPLPEGLQEGDSVVCTSNMREAIIELAIELNMPMDTIMTEYPHLNCITWTTKLTREGGGKLMLDKIGHSASRIVNTIPPETFIAKMRVTAKQHTCPIIFNKGHIKIGSTTITNDIMRNIVKNLKD